MLTDTIIAISSSAGTSRDAPGVRGIVRLSGPAAWQLVREVSTLPPHAARGWHSPINLLLNNFSAPAAIMLFHAPHSFTGQDIAELHLPNSPVLLRLAIESLLAAAGRLNLPARLATPGEFSARAFFNGKIDLTQAEGIAATINATSKTQLRAAAALREGALHAEIDRLTQNLANLLALIEAGIDFSDEEGISFVPAATARTTLEQLTAAIEQLLATAVRVDRLDSPPTIVLIGKPNVGKSSLINALAGRDRAIVSNIAGTTRDMLSATLHTPSGNIRLIDVPGEENPSDDLKLRMMDARRLALLEADLILHIIDHTHIPDAGDPPSALPAELIVIQNKCDLMPPRTSEKNSESEKLWGYVSAKTGEKIPDLRAFIAQWATRRETVSSNQIALNQRHRLLLQDARTTLQAAAVDHTQDEAAFRHNPELLAADLRRALDQLGQITGAISPDEVLGRIFSQFCLGK